MFMLFIPAPWWFGDQLASRRFPASHLRAVGAGPQPSRYYTGYTELCIEIIWDYNQP